MNPVAENLVGLDAVQAVLKESGYDTNVENDILSVTLFNGCKPVFFQIDEVREDLLISAHIAELNSFEEERLPQLMAAALIANSAAAPFAYSYLTDIDGDGVQDDPSEWTLVLMTRVPLSDFSVEELDYYTARLTSALLAAREVVAAGLPD